MNYCETLKLKILSGYEINHEEARMLSKQPIEELTKAADELRTHFCGDSFDVCTIVNAKSGKCSENCKFCAQSSFYSTDIDTYPLLSTKSLKEEALHNESRGILRYSLVTSGRTLTDAEVDSICESYEDIAASSGISLCASHGLLNYEQFIKLKKSGVNRYHNNMETSRRNFENICTTHTYDDKLNAVKDAIRAGLEVCSGGIMGLGETMQDRIDMIMDIRSSGVKSVPVNILNPIKGTPFENLMPLTSQEIDRIFAVFRFIMPSAAIRFAGGRGLLPDKGRSVFKSGANAAISGDMLTTSGISTDDDMKMIADLGFKVKKI